jgi:hypothetical protein
MAAVDWQRLADAYLAFAAWLQNEPSTHEHAEHRN